MGMKCPHCLHAFHDSWQGAPLGVSNRVEWKLRWSLCPNCGRFIVNIQEVTPTPPLPAGIVKEWQIYSRGVARDMLPLSSLGKYADDYQEACVVLDDSPKASAALSRRCLQRTLREEAKVNPGDLNSEIDQVLQSKQLPTHLAGAIDAIRVVGNFAAHPIKSTSTGEIVEVEAGEAEWTLDVLERLLDFYLIQPVSLQKKKDSLNIKLRDANKPPLK